MTRTGAEDESRSCGTTEGFEAAPVKAKYHDRTTNVTEDLEDRFDKQLDYICDCINEMLAKQVSIHQSQRAMHQAREQPEMAEEGLSSAEVNETLEQVSEKGVSIKLLHKRIVDNRKALTAAKRTERQFTLEAQMLRNEKEMEEEQERIEQRRRENERLQQEIAWLEENKAKGKGGKLSSRLDELVQNHEELRVAAIRKSRSTAETLARVESEMFNIKEDVKDRMRWEAAKTKGETELLERRLKRCEMEIAAVSGEAIKRCRLEMSVHEREVKRRQVRVLESSCEIEAIQEIQRKIITVSLGE